VEEQASGAQAVVQAMERMRELVQSSTSSSTELAASSDQMSKMSQGLLDSMDGFALHSNETTRERSNDRSSDRSSDRTSDSAPASGKAARSAAAGSR